MKEQGADDDLPPKCVRVPENTIVVNTNTEKSMSSELDIFHECIHYDWHYMFYRLQDMHNNDISQLKTMRIVREKGKYTENPLAWMEWQARRGSFALMMPLCVMKPLVKEKLEQLRGCPMHMGEKMDSIARTIARERNLPKFRVRARLIQMGHVEAKGALNYAGERYIHPFAFSRENGAGNYTFAVDYSDVYKEYIRNEDFRKRITNGQCSMARSAVSSACSKKPLTA